MYNRYIPDTPEPPRSQRRPTGSGGGRDPHRPSAARPAEGLGSLLRGFDLGGLLDSLGLGSLDTGDILLLLILLFLFLEGDNMELAIILGLLVLFGLGDDEDD